MFGRLLARCSVVSTRLFNRGKFCIFISPHARWKHIISQCDMSLGVTLPHCWKAQRLLSRFLNRRNRLFSTCIYLFQTPVAQVPGSLPEIVDPFKLVETDLHNLYSDIRRELRTSQPHLEQISNYYFDGQGKAFRPVMVVLMARALNFHIFNSHRLLETQHRMAIVTEMIHTASLIHDDVIDTSDTRRGKSSVNVLWGQNKAILAGDFVLSQMARILAQLGNVDVIHLLAQVLLDLVQGEFMQMSSTQDDRERFSNYLQKTFKKTASLIAYTCKAAAVLGGADPSLQEAAFQYGRNIGIAFQLIDDLLDFISSQAEMGKPAAADLKLGLATAPVLFASEKFPELKPLILRRFSEFGDVERAYEAVLKSDGLAHTRILAKKHCDEALRHVALLSDSVEKRALMTMIDKVLERTK